MEKQYTVEEAADYLGVTAQTIRNWDKSGKISCIRKAENNYRFFSIDDLDRIKSTVKPKMIRSSNQAMSKEVFELRSDRDLKRLISKLHRIVRDLDGRSSIIERFDELTKLFLVYNHLDGTLPSRGLDVDAFAEEIKQSYAEFLMQVSHTAPKVFEEIHLNNQCIFLILEYLGKFDLSNVSSDIKGLIYEEMIKDIFEKGDNQQFFTPKTVVSFMTNLLSTLTSGSICDPASGTGGFLINLVQENGPFNKFTALEIDQRLSWISGMNLEMHGCSNYESTCLSEGGTLGREADKFKESFDAVITNPPFGSDYSDLAGLKYFELGAGKSSRRRGVLFIERSLDLLKDQGYLAIVIDDGVLNHPSNEDVRNLVIKNTELLAVISLPITAFMPYASVEASILILRKSQKPKTVNTFYARAENVGKKTNGNEDYIYDNNGQEKLNNDLVAIQALWEAHLDGSEIKNSDFCYLSNIFETFQIDDNHSMRIDFAFHHYSRGLVRTALEKHSNKLVNLSEVCSEINEPLTPIKDLPEQTILYMGLANINSNSENYTQSHVPTNSIKSTVKRFEKGDVLFSKMRPNLRKCIVVDRGNEGYCSSECVVLRPNRKLIDGRLLSTILRSDFFYGQIVHLITGIGRPRVSVKDLRTIKIPIPSTDTSTALLKSHAKNMKAVEKLKMKSMEALKESEELQQNTTNELVTQLLQ